MSGATLKQALAQGEFVITCEFVPGRGREGVTVDAALQFVTDMAASGIRVHAVSLTDNPGGNPAISPDALAPEILERGMEPLVHFSCRDQNRNAIESRAMALSRAGIHNLFVITGDYTQSGYEGNAAGVFDLDSVQAIRYLKAMNEGLEVPGMKKGTTTRLPKTDFFVGAAVSPFKLREEELIPQFFKLEKKIAAGADFIIPQLGYNMRKFLEVKRFLDSRGLRVPLIGNTYVLSAGAARVMHTGGVPGCVVTEELLNLVEAEAKDPDKGKGKRLERAAKMVAVFRGMGFNGVHIGGFALKAEDFIRIIRRAEELQPAWETFIPELSFGSKDEFYAFPPPASYRPGEAGRDPVLSVGKNGGSFSYSIMRAFHRAFFDPSAAGFRMLQRYYRAIQGKKTLSRVSHTSEYVSKKILFGCKDCGDCALADMAYCCPRAQCAKQQRNGPCGGSINGMCEAYPDEKPCVWTNVYKRMKSTGELEVMRTRYVPPKKNELASTSGWENYFLGRDHAHVPQPAGEKPDAPAG